MAYFKEYVYEIDAETGEVVRHWAAGREVPAHINSDVTMSDSELIFCAGGSQSIVLHRPRELRRLPDPRRAPGRRDPAAAWASRGDAGRSTRSSRGSPVPNSRHFVSALRVTRGSLLDSVYACQLSADQSLLFTANRGLNSITVYDYPSRAYACRVPMPELQEYDAGPHPLGGPQPRLPPQLSGQPGTRG